MTGGWNFDPTSGHRLCSTHFTRDCFERDPLRMMELGVDGTFKRRLKPDATPNVRDRLIVVSCEKGGA
jgi:hypothetical protein